jgi:hypothetical protein
MKNIPAFTPNESNTSNLIFTTLIALTAIGLGLYVINKKAINSEYEYL